MNIILNKGNDISTG